MSNTPNVLEMEATLRKDPVKWARWKLKDQKGNPWQARWYQMDLINDVVNGKTNRLAVRMGRRVGKCLVGETLIVDPSTGERKRIVDLYEKQYANVVTMGEDFKLKTTDEVYVVNNGVKEIFEVILKSGKKVKATGNHPLYRVDGWVEVDDLKPGDKIATPRSLSYFGNESMDPNEVKLLAYMVGDGNTTSANLRFSSACSVVMEEFREVVNSFGDAKVKQYDYSNYCDYHIHNSDDSPKTRYKNKVRLLVEEHGLFGKSALQKEVPNAIFKAPKEQVAMFLSRLYATDGWASSTIKPKKHLEVGYASSSEELARGVQHLLLRFGIHSTLSTKWVKYKEGRNKSYTVAIHSVNDVIRFQDEIGIYSKEVALNKVVEVAKTMTPKDDAIPVEIMDEVERLRQEKRLAPKEMLHPNASMNDRYRRQYAPQRKKLEYWGKVLGSERLEQLGTSDIYWEEIVSIQSVGFEETYDLSVPETKNFVADDIIVHNTETMCIYMLWHAFHKKNQRLLVAAPYENQIRLIFKRLKELIATCPELAESLVKDTSNPYELAFSNGTAIIGFTVGATSGAGASVRGQRADFLFIDEIDYISRDGIDATIAISYENPKEIGIWASSTPTGKRDFFYKICTNRTTGYTSYHYPSMVNPNFDASMEAEFRSTMTEQGYVHEVMAEFGEETMGVFGKRFVEAARDEFLYSYYSLNEYQRNIALEDGYDLDKVVFMAEYTQKNLPPRAKRILGVDWDKRVS